MAADSRARHLFLPNLADAHNHLGVILREQGQRDEAEACFHQALRLRPNFAGAHNNLGRICEDRGRLDAAAARFRLALCHQPDDTLIHTNLGNVLLTQGKANEALPFHQKAVQLQPSHAVLHSNLAHTLTMLGQPDEAEACCRQALRLNPDLCDGHHNLAITLAAGSASRGNGLKRTGSSIAARSIREHETAGHCGGSRRASSNAVGPSTSGDGNSAALSLEHSRFHPGTVLHLRAAPSRPCRTGGRRHASIHSLPFLSQATRRVVMECQPALCRCARLPGNRPSGRSRFRATRLRLSGAVVESPRVFGTMLATVPANVPYLTPDADLTDRWRLELNTSALKVGIAWQGNPSFPGDRLRSIPLAHFSPLARIPGVRLFAIQKGPDGSNFARLAPHSSLPTFQKAGHNGAFLDTAAVIKCLDLVVTSDTAIAHLAGALGVPVWWRWRSCRLAMDDRSRGLPLVSHNAALPAARLYHWDEGL